MKNQDDATLKKVSFMNVAFAAAGYMVVMCAVFFTFGVILTSDKLQDEPFISAYGTEEWHVNLIRFALGMMMICAIPLNFIPLRESAWAMYCAIVGLKKVKSSAQSDTVEMSVMQPASVSSSARTLRDAISEQNTDANIAVIKTPLVEGSHNTADDDEDDGLPEMSTTHRYIFTLVLLSSGIVSTKVLGDGGIVMKILNYVGLLLAPIVMIVVPAYMLGVVFKPNLQSRFMFCYCALVVLGIVSAFTGDLTGLGDKDIKDGMYPFPPPIAMPGQGGSADAISE
jgi:hypothetical protein